MNLAPRCSSRLRGKEWWSLTKNISSPATPFSTRQAGEAAKATTSGFVFLELTFSFFLSGVFICSFWMLFFVFDWLFECFLFLSEL